MYKVEVVKKADVERKAREEPPMGPGFTEIPEGVESMEVWGSSFNDPGPDFCEFRLLDGEGKILAKKIVGGY